MFDAYKGTRKPMPEELREQVPLMKEALQTMNIPILTLEGYEADDILGTVAKHCQAEGIEVSIVSGDRDLLQLADEHIKIRIPKTSRGTTNIYDYYPDDVKREYQVTPTEFIDVKALMGDASDNIPGVPSNGEKTATNLIVTYGSIENAYDHVSEIKPPRAQKSLMEHYDMAQMSKELAAICITCPIPFSYEDALIGNLYTPEAFKFMKRMEFKSILNRFDAVSMSGAEGEEENIQKHFKVITNKKEAEKIDSDFRIYLGQELMDSEELLEDLKEGRAFTMAGSRYILIEFQPVVSFSHMCQRLRQLQMAGYLPVIAHMERYECLKRGERVRDLIQAGNFTQMNFSSLQGNPLHKNTRWCRRQVLDGNVHLLGTDMHHINQRTPDIKKAVSWLSRNCTRSRLYWMVWKNPAYIIKKKEGMGR